MVKGLLSGCIGLWIATIGYDTIQAVERFVFTDHLEGGINVIAALIGLFAIPQVIDMLENGRNPRMMSVIEVRRHPVLESIREVFGKVCALVVGSVVGVLIGLIPVAGGQIAGIVAYDQTRKFGPNRDRFGSGESEGVAGAAADPERSRQPNRRGAARRPADPRHFSGPGLFTTHTEVAWTFINSMLLGQILWLSGALSAGATAPAEVCTAELYETSGQGSR